MSEIIVTLKLDKDLINKVSKYDSKEAFCSKHSCEECLLFYYVDCEESFDAIKKELEK